MPKIVDEPVWLTEDAIEGKAERLLCEFESQGGGAVTLPIPVEKLAEKHLDLSILWCPIQDDPNEPILACINPQNREIQINERHRDFFDRYFGSQTFTLAHEIGHWVLHVQQLDVVQLALFRPQEPKPFLCRKWEDGKPDRFEWQANRFAGALAMPEALVRDYVRDMNICSWHAIYLLKDIFEVTPTALKNRLVTLGLLYVSPENGLYPNQEAYSGQRTL